MKHQGFMELIEELSDEFDPENECMQDEDSIAHKLFSPVFMSGLKFTYYGHKFLNTYVKNISIYNGGLKIAQVNYNHDDKQRVKCTSWLRIIAVKHVIIEIGLLDYYHQLAILEHGASKVNLLTWEFYDNKNY